jgi:tRNA threonylcarbamoyladenosine biosynthesis protein TsaE
MRIEPTGRSLVIEVASEAETAEVGRALAAVVEPGTVIGLIGPLGAGKTRLVRAVAEALGVDPGAIASPTFVLIHEYEGQLPVVHCDAYRLRGGDEFDALGLEESYGGGSVCLVEWADRVADRLPSETWYVRIEPLGGGGEGRRLILDLPEPVAQAMAARGGEAFDPGGVGY